MEGRQNAAQGEVVEVAVVPHVLHVPSPVGGEDVHERVALSVEVWTVPVLVDTRR